MRPFAWKIALCLGLVVGAGIITGLAFYQYQTGAGGFKLGVDLVGGTILVYEVDKDKFADARAQQLFEQESGKLASSLKKRIDPADLYNITVRQVGTYRVEIILPTGGQHQAEVEQHAWNKLLDELRQNYKLEESAALDEVPQGQVKQLTARVEDTLKQQDNPVSATEISKFIDAHYQEKRLTSEEVQRVKEKIAQVGSLEFRILANNHDDVQAIQLARAYFEKADKDRNSRERRVLTDAAITGKAPPGPRDDNANPFLPTSTGLGDFSYSWVEIGRLERHSLGLDNAAEGRIMRPDNNWVPISEFLQGEQLTPDEQEQRERNLRWHQVAVDRGEEKKEDVVREGRPVGVRFVKTADETWKKLIAEVRENYKLPANTDFKVPTGQVDQLAKRTHELLAGQKREEPVIAIEKFIKEHYQVETFKTVDMPQLGGCLLYSRVVPNPSRLSKDDQDKRVEYFLLSRDPAKGKQVTGEYLQSAFRTQDRNMQPAIGFRFNQAGGDRFYDLTSQNAPTKDGFHRFLAIALDGQIVSAPSLNAKISTEGIIEGGKKGFSAEEVDRYVGILNSGALPASLKQVPVSENTIGATLGQDTIYWGTVSVLLAFGAVLLFMVVYYRFAGLVACVALLLNLLLTLAFMVLVSATFTLPGLAGLVLMLGMAVDANVLIYERLREERERGATLALAIRNGYDRAFPTIIDTHMSSIFTAIVLYAVGNDQLKGFGISLTVGLIISLFTSLFVTRLLFDVWQVKGWLHKLSMLKFLSRPNIDFMAVRHIFFTLTIVTSVLGVALFSYRLNKGELNIDFVGGTAYTGQLTHPMSIEELRLALGEKAQEEKLQVTKVEQAVDSDLSYKVWYAGSDEPRRIEFPNQTNQQEVRKRAQQLPDLAVEQIFVASSDPKVRDPKDSRKTAFFTVRTTEKAADLVQASITRLLGEDLKKVGLKPGPDPKNPFQINATNTEASLDFMDLKSGNPTPASPAQVRALLDRELKIRNLSAVSQQFLLEGVGKQENGRFEAMRLSLTEPLERDQLEGVLKDVQREFQERPQPERLENFDSQLATETQTRALYAILASWGAILLYLWFRFGNWTFGAAAVLCLVHDLFFTLGAIAVCHYIHVYTPWLGRLLLIEDFKIGLPTVAALLTLVGYSVNDTIVVFDRIREVRGKNPDLTPKMINDSVNQTLSRTLLTSLVTWLVVIVLYIFGGEGVHLFAFVMVVGVIVGTYSSIYIASPLLLIFGEGSRGGQLRERAPQQPVGAV